MTSALYREPRREAEGPRGYHVSPVVIVAHEAPEADHVIERAVFVPLQFVGIEPLGLQQGHLRADQPPVLAEQDQHANIGDPPPPGEPGPVADVPPAAEVVRADLHYPAGRELDGRGDGREVVDERHVERGLVLGRDTRDDSRHLLVTGPKAFRSHVWTSAGSGIGGGIIAPHDGTAAVWPLSVLSLHPYFLAFSRIDQPRSPTRPYHGRRVLIPAREVVANARR